MKQTGIEDAVETRLLIKRTSSKGVARWDGVPYIWSTDASGRRVAKLALGGGHASVSWDHTDVDSGALHTGSAPAIRSRTPTSALYAPGAKDRERRSSPIGLQAAWLTSRTRAYKPESGFVHRA